MVQVLGRLSLSFGIFVIAGLSGLLAQWLSYQTVFLLGLIMPLISISGALMVRLETSERRTDRLAHPGRWPRVRRLRRSLVLALSWLPLRRSSSSPCP